MLGGQRQGAGRPRGLKNVMTDLARAEAKLAGMLPHEFLLAVVRGDTIRQRVVNNVINKQGKVIGQEIQEFDVIPDFQMRVDAAKAAAPYYAPRLATQVVTIRGREDVLNQLSDDQLDQAIKTLTSSGTRKKHGDGE
jgi:hypothetical protein